MSSGGNFSFKNFKFLAFLQRVEGRFTDFYNNRYLTGPLVSSKCERFDIEANTWS